MAFRRFKCRLVLLASVFLSALILVAHFGLPVTLDSTRQDFLEQLKCPACFGENLCPEIYTGAFKPTRWTQYRISKLLNSRNVYYGILSKEHQVVAKKLAHDWELQDLETKICQLAKKPPYYCNAAHYVRFLSTSYGRDHKPDKNGPLAKTISITFAEDVQAVSQIGNDYLGCVKSQDLMDFLTLKPQYHRSSFSPENIVSALLVNPEPLVLSTFPSEDGWPFPKLFGACGRVVFVEDGGKPLSDYLNEPFTLRARLALQVLDIAQTLILKHPDLAIHLTDWSQSNFAVDEDLKVRLIDLENIVVVNKTLVKEIGAPGWNVPHSSASNDGYSLQDLCSHMVSDNNIYGACQWILYPHADIPNRAGTRGLLYDIPQKIRSKHILLEKLLRECSKPSSPHPGARLEAVTQLREILSQI